MKESSKLVKGTFILTAGALISKIIGVLYTIPLSRMISGSHGLELYSYAYVFYTLILFIACGGFPAAISKFVAEHNSLGEYALGRKMFRYGQVIMLITGFIAFLLMYFLAPLLAISFDSHGFSVAQITTVLRSVSFTLIVVPSLAFFRGFFQGHGEMLPTSVSQVVEQLARVIFLLAGVYIAMYKMNRNTVMASSLATFAACIGAIAGLLVLFYFWKKYKRDFDELLAKDTRKAIMSTRKMFLEIFVSSIPFVFVAIAFPLFQQIDNWTFNRGMADIGQTSIASDALQILNVQAQSLVMIPITLATSFQISIIPTISRAITLKDYKGFKKHLDEIFTIILLILIPAVVGMSILAKEFFTVFYEYNLLGTQVLQVYAPTIITFSLLTVTGSILQGMGKQWFSVKSLGIGILIKVVLAIPFIHLFATRGAVYSTGLAYLVVSIMNFMMIKKQTNYQYKKVWKRSLLIIILTSIMALIVILARIPLLSLVNNQTVIGSLIIMIICIPLGGIVYLFLAYKTKLLYRAFGPKTDVILRKLKFKKALNES